MRCAVLGLIEERLCLRDHIFGHVLINWNAVDLRPLEHGLDLCSQAVTLQGPLRDQILEVVIDRVAGRSAGDREGGDSQSAFRKLPERSVNLLVDLPKLQQRLRMRVQAARQDLGIQQFNDRAAIMLIVIGEAEKRHHGWTQVYVIGKEIVRLRYAEILDSRSSDRDEGACD